MSTIGVITMWHQEQTLAPLFLQHYGWADQITVLLDEDMPEAEYLRGMTKLPNVRFVVTNTRTKADGTGMDDGWKILQINHHVLRMATDWVIVADADEFVYTADASRRIRDVLDSQPDVTLYRVAYQQIYRHHSEPNGINVITPVLLQRQHGSETPGEAYGQRTYCKPAVVRTDLMPQWNPGHHMVAVQEGICRKVEDSRSLKGAHWAMADCRTAIERRLRWKQRMSPSNYRQGFTSQHWHVTEEDILQECEKHHDDPRIIFRTGEEPI